ncbi:MAG: carboxypeptidase-like regulatory domain-containing protein [Bacteroidota bacterium]
MFKYIGLILVLIISCTLMAQAQSTKQDSNLVQFSGLVLDGTDDQLFPIPYTNILVLKKGRGTYTDFKGFFSIVVEKGDTIEFSAVGYETVRFGIPVDLKENRYSMVQLMTEDLINLPETVVFPWPSRDHFKLEFLAMDVTPELQEYAAENLASQTLDQLRENVPKDGRENAGYYLQQQAAKNYYIGQNPPMNIFNVVSWKKFFDSWKKGDFKEKKEE